MFQQNALNELFAGWMESVGLNDKFKKHLEKEHIGRMKPSYPAAMHQLEYALKIWLRHEMMQTVGGEAILRSFDPYVSVIENYHDRNMLDMHIGLEDNKIDIKPSQIINNELFDSDTFKGHEF
jgi:hypothetical protein